MGMGQTKYKYLKFISFKEVSQWYVEYYMNENKIHSGYSLVPLRELIAPKKNVIKKEEYDGSLPIVEKIVFKTGKVVFRDKKVTGMNLYSLQQGDLLISNINFHQGATALNTFGDIAASTHYQPYSINPNKIDPGFLVMVLRSPYFLSIVSGKKAQGIKNESGYNFIGSFSIPLPPLKEQREIVTLYTTKVKEAEDLALKAEQAEQAINSYLFKVLEIDKEHRDDKIIGKSVLKFVKFKTLKMWGYDKLIGNNNPLLQSQAYPNKRLGDILEVNPTTTFLKLSSDAEISFIPMECVSGEYGVLKEKRRCKIMFSKGYTKFQNGDLIWARITPCMQNGKSAIVDELINGYGCGSTEFHVLRNHNKQLSLEYIHILLRQSIILTDAMNYFTGSAGQQRVPKSYLENLSVPIPPFQIQNAIVAHIKESKKQVKVLRQKAKDLRIAALIEFENKIFE